MPVHHRISVVIPTYNRGPILADTLRMVLQQDYGDYELIVVDQSAHCAPEVDEVIASAPERIRYLRLDTPNLPAARNAGVRVATGDLIIFLDDDVELGPGYLTAHARHYADEKIGGVAGLLVSRSEVSTNDQIQRMLVGFQARKLLEDGSAHVSWINGGNTSYRRTAIIAAGMSDERFGGTAWAEDADLSVRVRHNGFVLLFDPEIRLLHLEARAGGCENRCSSEAKDAQRLLLYTYFLFKNRSIIGSMFVLRELARNYRHYAVTRRSLRGGPAVVLRRSWTFLKSTRRALLCVSNPALPVVD